MTPSGEIWIAAPNLSRLLQVAEGGEVLRTLMPWGDPYACMLGGEDNQTLFIASSETDDPTLARAFKSGRIETLNLSDRV
jgi:sugar lactone lactonase YvrE